MAHPQPTQFGPQLTHITWTHIPSVETSHMRFFSVEKSLRQSLDTRYFPTCALCDREAYTTNSVRKKKIIALEVLRKFLAGIPVSTAQPGLVSSFIVSHSALYQRTHIKHVSLTWLGQQLSTRL